MASRLSKQFLQSFGGQMYFVEGSFQIGASGAIAPTSAIVGNGVSSAQNKGTGQYQIQLQDPYNRLLDAQFVAISPTSAAGPVTDGSFVIGKPYQILFPSTSTNWYNAGLPVGFVPAQGMPFVATTGATNGPLGSSGVTAAGSGTAVAVSTTGIASFEVLPNPNTEMYRASSAGAVVMFQTLNNSGVATSPTSGAVIRFNFTLRNSSLVGTNELPTNY